MAWQIREAESQATGSSSVRRTTSARSAELGFTVQGLKSRHRKKAERMKPGDKMVYYVTGQKAFGGIVTIESPYFESHEAIWMSGDPKKAAEDYPFRVKISPDVILGLETDSFRPSRWRGRCDTRRNGRRRTGRWRFRVTCMKSATEDYRLIRDCDRDGRTGAVWVTG